MLNVLTPSVLTRPEHIQAVFSDSDKHCKAVNNNAGYIMGQLLGQCVGLVSGREWQASRAVTEVPFVHRSLAHHVPMIRRHVESYMNDLESRKSLRAGLLRPAEDLKFLPFWIVAEVFYGRLPAHLEDWLKRLIPLREDLFKDVIQGGITRFAVMRFFPTAPGRKLVEFKREWESFNRSVYEHSRQAKPAAPIVQMYEVSTTPTLLSLFGFLTLLRSLCGLLKYSSHQLCHSSAHIRLDLSRTIARVIDYGLISMNAVTRIIPGKTRLTYFLL